MYGARGGTQLRHIQTKQLINKAKMTIRGLPDTAPEPEPNPSSEPEPRFQYQAPDPSIFFDLDAGSSTDSSSSSLESNNNNQYNHGEDAMGGSNSKVTTPSDFRYAATSPDVFKFPNIRPKLEKQDNGPEYAFSIHESCVVPYLDLS